MSIMQNLQATLGIKDQAEAQCAHHGTYTSMLFDRGDAPAHWSGCPTCDQEAMVAADHERIVADRLDRAGIPPRFQGVTFESYQTGASERQAKNLAQVRRYAEDFPVRSQNGEGLVLMGAKGTGKTHLALATVEYVVRTHAATAHYTLATRMFRRLKDTYNVRSEETEGQVLRAYAAPDLLAIDEIGLGHCSPTELGHLFEIINERYEYRRPSIIVTNLDTADELQTWLGERTMDRLREGCRALLFDWDSHRAPPL